MPLRCIARCTSAVSNTARPLLCCARWLRRNKYAQIVNSFRCFESLRCFAFWCYSFCKIMLRIESVVVYWTSPFFRQKLFWVWWQLLPKSLPLQGLCVGAFLALTTITQWVLRDCLTRGFILQPGSMLISVKWCDFYHHHLHFYCLDDICPLSAIVGFMRDGAYI